MSSMEGGETLPDGFFENLTDKQRALLEILVEADGEFIRGVELRQEMRDRYNFTVPEKPGAIAGLLSGFTQRYSEPFRRDLIRGRWVDGHTHVELQIGSKYKEELRSRLR